MAGITDRPFREICKSFAVDLAFSEMVASNPDLKNHKKTILKANHSGEGGLKAVQIVGTDPQQMADAAKLNEIRGAEIIDINMGCPAKKVCSVAAGSALLKDEDLVKRILDRVVNAVAVPVTLKIRTGWDKNSINAHQIANIAEESGIAAITIHGRTRACKFHGEADYTTIRAVKESVSIPVIANGDIDSSEKAEHVLKLTKADAVMIGRAAQGRPWIFNELQEAIISKKNAFTYSQSEISSVIYQHLEKIYQFYGNTLGVRIARKHIGWYFDNLGRYAVERKRSVFQAENPDQQLTRVNSVLSEIEFPLYYVSS